MNVTVESQPKSELKLTIELSVEEMQPHLQKAAESLSSEYKIQGFRPGKASLGIVIQKLGAAVVWEAAAEFAVRKSFVQAVMDHKLQTIGTPHVHIQKLAADNPFVFTAEIAVLPEITLGAYQQLRVKKPTAKVTPAETDKALADLREMFATEAQVDRAAQMGDKVEVDFDLHIDQVLVEGGSSKQHPIKLGSKNFIPGFEDQLVGMKKDERKTFSLPFPKDYHNQQVAGKNGEFSVTMKSVFNVTTPDMNDEFAQRAGKFQNVAELRAQLEKNLLDEATEKLDATYEREVVDALIAKSKFGELPEVLVTNEVEKMLHELEDQVTQQGGVKFEDYLKGLKKTVDELKKDFRPKAEQRVKAALLIRQVAKQEKIEAEPGEIETEVKQTLKLYQGQPDILKRIDSDDYRDYVRSLIINRKVVQKLKDFASRS